MMTLETESAISSRRNSTPDHSCLGRAAHLEMAGRLCYGDAGQRGPSIQWKEGPMPPPYDPDRLWLHNCVASGALCELVLGNIAGCVWPALMPFVLPLFIGLLLLAAFIALLEH